MATENIMMDAVKKGGDRQAIHERIRQLSLEAGHTVKELGLPNDLLDRLAAEPMLGLSREELEERMDPAAYIGRCPQQVEEFLKNDVGPVLAKYASALNKTDDQLTI